jgi:tetratricopeptide (TPR) repeat protein
MELTLTPAGVDRVQVAVNGAAAGVFALSDVALDEEWAKELRDDPAAYGHRLYDNLFPPGGPAAEALADLPLAPDQEGTILLVADHPALAAVPWEYVHDGRRFLALDYYLLRGLPEEQRQATPETNNLERLPILFVPCSPLLKPDGELSTPLEVFEEWETLVRGMEDTEAPYDLVQVLPPTVDGLERRLARANRCVVHFSGHGAQSAEEAYLLFERPNGASDPIPAGRFARQVRDEALLVFLSACISATPGPTELANLARLLVVQGIPYALGMQFAVPDDSARRFADFFYTYLAGEHTVAEATRRARMALEKERPLAMGIPVLYTALERPHTPFRLGEGKPRVLTPPPGPQRVDLMDVPTPVGKFVGRQRELVRLGTLLTDDRHPPLVTVHGGGGMGKTALARRAALRFAWAFPDGILALSVENLPSPEQFLNRLGGFFDVQRNPEEPVERWHNRVAEAIRGARALLLVDNFETVVWAREESEEARAIGDVLRRGAGGRCVLLLTGREMSGLAGEQVVDLGGLDPEAGARLFAGQVGGRREALDEAKMQALSEQVGGHPLALRLLAAAFDATDLSLEAFRNDLAGRLPRVRDGWSDEARQESLWGCFDYSYDALPEDLQALFPPLGIFQAPFLPQVARAVLGEGAEGGLHRLWRRGMLERLPLVDPDGQVLLYRLHPALQPYAQAKAGEEKLAALRPGFGAACAALASSSYGTIWEQPLLAQLVRLALPDLGRAVAWVEDEKRASTFRFHLGWLVRHYGDLEGAMRLYQEALEIKERLGDQKGKSATLHEMAYIHTVRGDLEGAMRLYQESLEIKERLGDQKGKSATLHAMANIHTVRGDLEGAMRLYQEALEIDERLGDQQGKASTLAMMGQLLAGQGEEETALRTLLKSLDILSRLDAAPDAVEVAGIIASFRQQLGPERFQSLWNRVAEGQPLPEWLSRPPAQAISLPQFLELVEQAVREGGEEAQKVWQVADQMASDPQAPEELRTLGQILTRVLSGDTTPDISSLPEGLAGDIRDLLERLAEE